MVELRVKRNAVLVSDAEALNGGVVVVPKDVFSTGRLDVVEMEGRVAVVWRRMLGLSDVVLLEYDGALDERAREVVPKLAALLADKVLRVEMGGGRGVAGRGWKVAAVASWMLVGILGGVLGGAAAMGGEASWSRLGAMAAAKVWPSTCPTPGAGEGAGGAAVAAMGGGALGGTAGLGGVAGGGASGAGAASVVGATAVPSVVGADEMKKRIQDAERAVQAQVERLSREQAEQATGNVGAAVPASTGARATVKTGVFVPLAE